MKEEKTKKKKSIYYILLAVGVALLAAATVLTVWFTTRGSDVVEVPPVEEPDDPSGPSGPSEPEEPEEPDEPDEPTGPSEPDGPEYVRPISVETCSVDYDAIYVSDTTDFIYRHKAVDFAADAGTEVYAMADGTVSEISLSEELGNLITIDHGDGLVSCYRFVEPQDGLKAGDKVEQGGVLGKVASPYGTEAHGGAHLHFELALDGESVDPADHLDLTYEEK